MITDNGIIKAPVSIDDLRGALGNSSGDLGVLVVSAASGGLPCYVSQMVNGVAVKVKVCQSAFYIDGVEGYTSANAGRLISGALPGYNIWAKNQPTYLSMDWGDETNPIITPSVRLWNEPGGHSDEVTGGYCFPLLAFDGYDKSAEKPKCYVNVKQVGYYDGIVEFGADFGDYDWCGDALFNPPSSITVVPGKNDVSNADSSDYPLVVIVGKTTYYLGVVLYYKENKNSSSYTQLTACTGMKIDGSAWQVYGISSGMNTTRFKEGNFFFTFCYFRQYGDELTYEPYGYQYKIGELVECELTGTDAGVSDFKTRISVGSTMMSIASYECSRMQSLVAEEFTLTVKFTRSTEQMQTVPEGYIIRIVTMDSEGEYTEVLNEDVAIDDWTPSSSTATVEAFTLAHNCALAWQDENMEISVTIY